MIERMKNPYFWIELIASIIVLLEVVGIDIVAQLPILKDYETIVLTLFSILAMFGVVMNPTTPGIKD